VSILPLTTLAGVPLSGRRVRLERLAPRHISSLHRIASDEAAATMWPLFGRIVSAEEFEGYLWRLSQLQFVVLRRDSGVPVGLLQGVDEDLRNGTIGLALFVDPTLWQAGWPFEGAVLFLEYLFNGLGYRKVYCHMPASVLDRLGGPLDVHLVREGTFNQHLKAGDGYEDLHISSIHREAWDSNYARRITGNSTPMNTTSLGDDEQATDRP